MFCAYCRFTMRILVVEDERLLAGFIAQALQAEGHSVTVCHDGDAGLAAALTGDYALVLLDVMLPGLPGLSVLDGKRLISSIIPVSNRTRVVAGIPIVLLNWSTASS